MKREQVNRILNEIAGQVQPDDFDLWPRIHAKLQPKRSGSLRIALGVSTIGAVLLVTLFAFGIWSAPRINISIRALESTPAATMSAGGLKSYRGMITGRLNVAHQNSSYPYLEWQRYVWYEAPGNLRTEVFQMCPNEPVLSYDRMLYKEAWSRGSRAELSGPTNERCTFPDTINIRTEAGFVQAVPSNAPVTVSYPDRPVLASLGSHVTWEDALIPSQTGLDAVEQEYAEDYASVALIGTDTIAGRLAYVLDMKAKSLANPIAGQLYEARRVMWVDEETYIPLALESLDNRSMVFYSWSFTSFEANPTFDPGIFAYIPPSGPQVYFVGLRDLWQTLAQKVHFTVFMPGSADSGIAFLSSKLIANRPSYDAEEGVITATYLSRSDPTKPSIVLTVIEGAPSAVTALVGSRGQGEIIDGDGWTGYYSVQNGTGQLILNRNGTQIALQGQAEILKKDLIAMARSLQAITPGVGPDKQGLAIPPGMKAVDIRSDQLINGYPTGQSPQSGDQVSLTISFQFADAVATGDSQLPATQRVGEARQMSVTYPALVVSIGPPPSDGHDGSTHQPSPTPPAGGTAVITFALGERDAVTLNWAVNSKLPIWMTLRGTDS